MRKTTMSFSADPVLVERIKNFADTMGMSRSTLLNKLLEQFLMSHEKAQCIHDPELYNTTTMAQSSYFCATEFGVMMTFNFDMDFTVDQEAPDV